MPFLLLNSNAMALVLGNIRSSSGVVNDTSSAGNGLVSVAVSDEVHAVLEELRLPGETDSDAFVRIVSAMEPRAIQ